MNHISWIHACSFFMIGFTDVTMVQSKDVLHHHVWGSVTRAKAYKGEINLSIKDGLWSGSDVYLYRNTAGGWAAHAAQVDIADGAQSVITCRTIKPQVGDRILHMRAVPSEDTVINSLIGKTIEVKFKPWVDKSKYAASSAILLDFRVGDGGGIQELHCLPRDPSARVSNGVVKKNCDFRVPSSDISSVESDIVRLLSDPVTESLFAKDEWVKRDRIRRQMEAERTRLAEAAAAEAERTRLAAAEAERTRLAEAERTRLAAAEAERTRLAAAAEAEKRRKRDEEISQSNWSIDPELAWNFMRLGVEATKWYFSDNSGQASMSDQPVHVREYTRRDGTRVPSHVRSRPTYGTR